MAEEIAIFLQFIEVVSKCPESEIEKGLKTKATSSPSTENENIEIGDNEFVFPLDTKLQEKVRFSQRPKRKKKEVVENKKKKQRRSKKPKTNSLEEEFIDIETVNASEENTIAADQLKSCSTKLCGGVLNPHLVDLAYRYFKNGVISKNKVIEIEFDENNRPVNCFGCLRQRQVISSRGNSKRCNLCDRLQLFLKTKYQREKKGISSREVTSILERMNSTHNEKLLELREASYCVQEFEKNGKKYSEPFEYSKVTCK